MCRGGNKCNHKLRVRGRRAFEVDHKCIEFTHKSGHNLPNPVRGGPPDMIANNVSHFLQLAKEVREIILPLGYSFLTECSKNLTNQQFYVLLFVNNYTLDTSSYSHSCLVALLRSVVT